MSFRGAESDEPSQTRRRTLYFRGKPAVVCGNRAVAVHAQDAARYSDRSRESFSDLHDRHRALQQTVNNLRSSRIIEDSARPLAEY